MKKNIKSLLTVLLILFLSEMSVAIFQFLFAGIRLLMGKTTSIEQNPMSLQYLALAAQITFGILTYKFFKWDLKDECSLKENKCSNIVLTIVLAVCFLMINLSIVFFVHKIGAFNNSFQQKEGLFDFLNSRNYLLWLMSAGIFAPLGEEILFRGVIFNILSKSMNVKYVIFVQAMLFAIFHMNLLQGLLALLIGIMFGYLRYRTNSILPAITLHMFNNIISEIANLYLGQINNEFTVYLLFIIIGSIGLYLSVKAINKLNLIEIN